MAKRINSIMILNEIFNDNMDAYEDPATDQEVPKLNDLRKVKLTLGQIHKLRLLSDVRKFEQERRLKQIQRQYGSVTEPTGM